MDETISSSVPSTHVDVPLEYDTDDMKRELTQFGDAPGPITKTTKKLYLKKLMKYKRNPEFSTSERNAASNPSEFIFLITCVCVFYVHKNQERHEFFAKYRSKQSKMRSKFMVAV